MTALPAELREWAESLALVADELQPSVAQVARRLDALLGPLRPRVQRRGDEPDGFSGLARRGRYDRLLLSEWAMLDEVPDEFVRRAVAGEHAFYQLETRQPRGGLRVRVVFDAGPGQLGAPRLVHLAALVVLSRRAAFADAAFTWSVAQAPATTWDVVDRTSVGALLASRSAAPFQLPDLSGEPEADELWVIGPAPDPKWGRTCALELTEPITLGPERVEAVLHRGGRRSDPLELLLPPGPLRRRLLLDPLAPPQAAPVPTPSPGAPPAPGFRTLPDGVGDPVEVRFIPGTCQLTAFFRSGEALTWSLANIATRTVPRAKARSCPGRVAFGWYNQRPLEVAITGDAVVASSRTEVTATVPKGADAPTPGRGQAVSFGPDATWFTDGAGLLWHVGGGTSRLAPPRGRCLDLFPVQEGAVALLVADDGLEVHGLGADGRTSPRSHHPDADAGFFTGTQNVPPRLVACAGDTWTAWTGTTAGASVHAEGRAPLGIRTRWDEPTRCHVTDWLAWWPGTGQFELGPTRLTVPRTPLRPRGSADCTLVAFCTAEGTVEVWRVDTGEPVMLRCRRG